MADEPKKKTFEGHATQDKATSEAIAWINDHSQHGSIYIKHFGITYRDGGWCAEIAYTDA